MHSAIARLGLVLAVLALLTACAGTEAADANLSAVFEQFPPCEPPPASDAVADEVEGLVLPEGAIITAISRNGPVTDIRAYVARTPVEVRAEYEAQTDIDILTIEDEIFETEVLVRDGEFLTYAAARVACRTGSHISAVVTLDDPGAPTTSAPGRFGAHSNAERR